jgi:DNA replication protein DnaC
MLVEQTMEKLVSMKLQGMAEALRRWLERPKEKDMTPADLIGLLADAEWNHREQKRLSARLRNARFRQDASIEDIDYQHARGLAKAVILDLATCRWVTAHQNVIFTGHTGVGKSYLACALGQRACRDGHTVVYRRASPRWTGEIRPTADGSKPANDRDPRPVRFYPAASSFCNV